MTNPHDAIPADLWVCCMCGGPNLIANADSACPVCNHFRNSCCSGPGDPIPAPRTNNCTGTPYDVLQHGAAGSPAFYAMQNGYANSSLRPSQYTGYTGDTTEWPRYSHLADQPPDVWICSECQAENRDWYDQCPICNVGTRNTATY